MDYMLIVRIHTGIVALCKVDIASGHRYRVVAAQHRKDTSNQQLLRAATLIFVSAGGML